MAAGAFVDDDGDGAISDLLGGTDCDDHDPLVYPGAAEVRDGKDNECDADGAADESLIAAGDIVISEIYYDTAGTPDQRHEWLEVFNPTPVPINLRSWTLSDQPGSSQQLTTIVADVIVPALGSAVLCAEIAVAEADGVACDYQYGFFELGNSADEVILRFGGLLVDEVWYDESPWPVALGESLQLDPSLLDATSNDLPASWCPTANDPATELASGDHGTPGATNLACGGGPAVVGVAPGDGIDEGGEEVRILGSGFVGVTSVEIDGTPCTSWQVQSTEEILCTTPAHAAGLVDVTVQTSGGSSTLVDGYRQTGVELVAFSALELNRPAATSSYVHLSSQSLFGRVTLSGVTGSCPASGSYAPSVLIAEVGYGPAGSDPRSNPGWQWFPAWCDSNPSSGKDEFIATLTVPVAGTYAYTFRFSEDGGADFAYADLTGSGDGFHTADLGVIYVGVEPPAPGVPTLPAPFLALLALAFAFLGANAARRR
jgi:hypothetical protein